MTNNSFEQSFNDAVFATIGSKYINVYEGESFSEDSPYFCAEDYYKGKVEGLTRVIYILCEKFMRGDKKWI